MSGYRAVVSRQGTIRKSVIGLLAISAPLQEQEECFIPSRLTGFEDFVNAGTNIIPDLFPYFARWPSQRPGMFFPQAHSGIVIVVQERELRSPTHPHRKARREQSANNSFQALWPFFDGTERGLRPIELTNQLAERPSAANPSWHRGGFCPGAFDDPRGRGIE